MYNSISSEYGLVCKYELVTESRQIEYQHTRVAV